jgi:hypothetical protein
MERKVDILNMVSKIEFQNFKDDLKKSSKMISKRENDQAKMISKRWQQR